MKKLFYILLLFLFVGVCYGQDTFDSCPPKGTSTNADDKELSRKKNRWDTATTGKFDKRFTFSRVLVPGNDTSRFDDTKAGKITGYVLAVKWGSVEHCNCDSTRHNHQDVHIELVQTAAETNQRRVVIVEITPRLRRSIFTQLGLTNMSNTALLHLLTDEKVKIKVTGWLLFDTEHKSGAENTDLGDTSNNRVTVWEIHPVTKIKIY